MNDNLDIAFLKMGKEFNVCYPQLKEFVDSHKDGSTTMSALHEVTGLHSELWSMSDIKLETIPEISYSELETMSKTDLEPDSRSGPESET